MTCKASCGSARTDDDAVVLIAEPTVFFGSETLQETVMAHEFGHYLSLGHEDNDCVAGDIPHPNLMRDSYSSGAANATLTAEQCDVARDVAMQYLTRWGS